MARSIPQKAHPDSVAASASASASSSRTNTSRVAKSRSENTSSKRAVRMRARMLEHAGGRSVVDELMSGNSFAGGAGSSRSSRGKGKAKISDLAEGDVEMLEDMGLLDGEEGGRDVCPITDKDVKPFPVMDLPTEIRLEIWRACLTRPYNILLSKRELPPTGKEENGFGVKESSESDWTSDDDEEEEGGQRLGGIPGSQASPHGPTANTHSYMTRSTRQRRMPSGGSTAADSSGSTWASGGNEQATRGTVRLPGSRTRRTVVETRRWNPQPEPERSQNQDPLITNVLRASKEIYKEARSVLYSENHFVLDLNTAMQTLGHLHQRSRRQIKHVELEIPTYNEILERFQETVRLSLRYCSGLKKFIIHMPFTLPGADGSGTTGNTTVYANGFDILRWLPQECDIVMKGNICAEIDTVVNKHLLLAKTLDKLAYARRQLISNETSSSTAA